MSDNIWGPAGGSDKGRDRDRDRGPGGGGSSHSSQYWPGDVSRALTAGAILDRQSYPGSPASSYDVCPTASSVLSGSGRTPVTSAAAAGYGVGLDDGTDGSTRSPHDFFLLPRNYSMQERGSAMDNLYKHSHSAPPPQHSMLAYSKEPDVGVDRNSWGDAWQQQQPPRGLAHDAYEAS